MDPVPTANKFNLLAGEDIDVSLTETTLPVIAGKKTVSLVINSPMDTMHEASDVTAEGKAPPY